ncbi:hypothetical protein [Antrihabitans spumae]|uniref:Uncharacterized protein n=1 Tax=Antrihabitans spumae TaxID=3373370 RepID=A0ABW7K3P4_9NOCA
MNSAPYGARIEADFVSSEALLGNIFQRLRDARIGRTGAVTEVCE